MNNADILIVYSHRVGQIACDRPAGPCNPFGRTSLTCKAYHSCTTMPPFADLVSAVIMPTPSYLFKQENQETPCFGHCTQNYNNRTALHTSPLSAQPPTHTFTSSWTPSPTMLQKTSQAILDGWAPSTRKNHDAVVKVYNAFCTCKQVPLSERYPAVEQVIVAFAADRAGRIAGTTARNLVTGLKAYHVARNWPWNGSQRVKLAVEGVETARPRSSVLESRLAVTLIMLRILFDTLDPNNPFDCVVLTCALVAFWGQFRLGKLLPKSQGTFADNRHPTISSWTASGRLITIRLPWTKTTKSAGAEVLLQSQKSRTCPVLAMNRLTQTHKSIKDKLTHLFAYPLGNSKWIPLTKQAFLARVNSVWKQSNLPKITGHCFRIGGTTELLRLGVAPEIVCVAG
jgi:hypothetical protein